MDPIRILIVDDHSIVRQGIRSLLSNYDHFAVIGEAESGPEALELAAADPPDVILLDIRLPGLSGLEVLTQLRFIDSGCRVLMLSSFDDDEYVMAALQSGAQGYVLKSASDETLVQAIEATYRGERVLSPQVTEKVVQSLLTGRVEPPAEEIELDQEEIAILRLLAAGASNTDVADQLYISSTTFKRKMRRILEKMGVQTRVQAVAEGVRRGII